MAGVRMTRYILHHNQNGTRIAFGAETPETARLIAGALLHRMTTDRGGELFTYDNGSMPLQVAKFERCGGITVYGVHACTGASSAGSA